MSARSTRARTFVEQRRRELTRASRIWRKTGLVEGVDAICSRVTVVDDLHAAVSDVDYVQESVFERIPEKREVSAAIGALIRDNAVVGSSSSGIPASAFTEHAPRRERFLAGHLV